MPGYETFAPDDSIELPDRVPKAFFGRNVETGLEQMGCIQTSRETFRKLRAFNNLRKLLERITETTPLSGGDEGGSVTPLAGGGEPSDSEENR